MVFLGFSIFGVTQTLLKRAYRLIGRFITIRDYEALGISIVLENEQRDIAQI